MREAFQAPVNFLEVTQSIREQEAAVPKPLDNGPVSAGKVRHFSQHRFADIIGTGELTEYRLCPGMVFVRGIPGSNERAAIQDGPHACRRR